VLLGGQLSTSCRQQARTMEIDPITCNDRHIDHLTFNEQFQIKTIFSFNDRFFPFETIE
jgi:hypothetical protein